MYDNICKFIAETFPGDIATWLLGEPIVLTKLEPSELSVEPIRADSLILLQSEGMILHVEFQTEPKPDLPFRMADYQLRSHRRYPTKQMRQVVIYLRRSRSPLVYQNVFQVGNLRHEFEIIRMWEQPTQPFLQSPGLLPFAVLSQTENSSKVLQQVAAQIEVIGDSREQNNVAASVAIIAGLVLNKNIIQSVLKQDIMRESVIYQELIAEGMAKGIAEGMAKGIAEGKAEGEVAIVLRLLKRKLGEVKPELKTKIQTLTIEQLEELGEALLDFQSEKDLVKWLG